MKINIKPLLYGTWVLRNTNDIKLQNFKNNNNDYLIINNDHKVNFISFSYVNIFGIKKSRKAYISNILELQNDNYSLDFNYIEKNTYTYSILDIEIPEIKTKTEEYIKNKTLKIHVMNNILLICDNSVYYVFDLYLGNLRYPNIETSLNTFLFTQLFGIIIGLLITKLFN